MGKAIKRQSGDTEVTEVSKGELILAGEAAEQPIQLDLFLANLTSYSFKDDKPSMEYPFFSLSKKPDRNIRVYEHDGVSFTITPSVVGMATIYDKDILIYCASHIKEGMNRGMKPSRRVLVVVYDLLMAIGRGTGGNDYKALIAALERLAGTRMKTNLVGGEEEHTEGFGLIESYKLRRKLDGSKKLDSIEIVLSEYFYQSIVTSDVLTIPAQYFSLTGGLERRLYEIARKFCGHQPKFVISEKKLHMRTGASCSEREFRRLLKEAVSKNDLPQYELDFIVKRGGGVVLFYNRKHLKQNPSLKESESS